MGRFLRRLRGIFGLGLTWSIVWALAGAATGAFETLVLDRAPPGLGPRIILASTISWASYGFVLGCLFAIVLAIAERRRTLEQLATWRLAVWGGLAGIVLPLAFFTGLWAFEGLTVSNGFSATFLSAALGAGCAAGSLAIARAGLTEPARRASLPG